MESINRVVTLHKDRDLEQNILLDHHWEIYDPILSCSNQEQLPTFCSTQSDVHFQKSKVWESGLPLCIIPQVFHFPELIDWCVAHYSAQTRSIVTQFFRKSSLLLLLKKLSKC